MIRALLTLLCVAFIGCASNRQAPAPTLPTPGRKTVVIKSAKAFVPRASYSFGWTDCAPQPPGAVYRVYETTNLVEWILIAETTDHSFTVPCAKPAAFYKVSAFMNGIEAFAVKYCPED